MPVCWLCTHYSATPTPTEHRHHPAHCENDCGSGCWPEILPYIVWYEKKWPLMYEFVFRWADRLVWWPHRSFPSSWSQRRRLPQWTSGCGLLFWTQVRVGQRSDSFLMSKWTLIYYITCFLDDLPKKKPPQLYKPSNPDTLAYLDFSVSTTGMLAGVKVSINHGRNHHILWGGRVPPNGGKIPICPPQ